MTKIEAFRQYKDMKSNLTEQIYQFLGSKMIEDPRYQAYLKECYDQRDYDEKEMDFDTWFKETYFNPNRDCFKEGVQDWLGQMKYRNLDIDQWLKDINLLGFVDNLTEEVLDITLNYTDGRHPGNVYSMMLNPRVTVSVELPELWENIKKINS